MFYHHREENWTRREKFFLIFLISLGIAFIYQQSQMANFQEQLIRADLDLPLYSKISQRLEQIENTQTRIKEILILFSSKIGPRLDQNLNEKKK